MATAATKTVDAAGIGVGLTMTVLGSGSSGNCSLISHGDTHLLIDAGFSGKETATRLAAVGVDPADLTAVLVTHEHADHIKSAHTLSNRLKIPILCTEGTFTAAFADKKFFDWTEIVAGRSFSLGAMVVHPISLPHDAADPVGVRIECGGRVLAHLTDFGYPSGLILESLKGCDTLLVEANHDLDMLKDGPYPWFLKQRIASRLGHCSNDSFLEMLPEILSERTRHLVLGHMSRTNNDPRLVTMQLKQVLRSLGLEQLPFTIASQDEPMEPLTV